MVKKLTKRLLPVLLAVMMLVSVIPMGIFTASAATTVTVVDGKVTITDTATSMSESGGTVTVTAKGGLLSQTTNKITITNNSGSTATLSFDYSASNYSSFSESNASGTISAMLKANETVEMSIKGKRAISSNTATLKLSNFNLVVAASSSKVTFNFDSGLGSVTVDGAAISTGAVAEVPLSGAALVATPASGTTFHGWVNAADGMILSTAATYTLKPANDMTVKPVFIGANSKPHFMIGGTTQKTFKYGLLSLSTGTFYTVPSGTHIFDDLNAAATASASSSASKAIVLLNSSTLPAGNYTIPAGSTLLVPNDEANTLYTGQPEFVEGNARVAPTAYRTLKVAAGANITVNGSISVTSKHCAAAGSKPGCLNSGPYGCINLAEGSTVTLNSGANLYAWGFITGSGDIYAKSGSKVMEYFQFTDFRGGTKTSDLAGDEAHGVFPFNQYYVQNIEAPITLSVGAIEKSYCSITMSGSTFCEDLTFIGDSEAMFQLTGGTVTKRYDGSTDRLVIEANGDFSINPIKISISTTRIDTEKFELPINSNITIQVNSGTIQINQDAALFPGSEIIVKDGVTCTLGSGVSIYAYDADEWGPYCFGNKSVNQKFWPVVYAPGRTYNRTNADIVDAKIQLDGYIDASKGYVYTTASGANIFSTGTGKLVTNAGTQTETYQFIQAGTVNGATVTEEFVSIPIVPGKLKNIDGSYIQSATDTYTYNGIKWVCEGHNYTSVVTPPTCSAKGYTTHTCTVCGDVYTDSVVAAVAHTYSSVITKPTCDAQGYTTHTCTVCGYSHVDSIVDPTDHTYGDWEVVTKATCTQPGLKQKVCACGDKVTEEIPVVAHSYDAVVTDPTCTEQGFTTYTCGACGDNYKDNYVDALGHTYGDWTTRTAAGCETDGVEYRVCACGDEQTRAIAATGHTYGNWTVRTAATCVAEGLEYRACACGKEETRTVAALGHSYSDKWTVDVAPTDLAEGSESRHCSNCDSTIDSRAISALTDFVATVSNGVATVTGYKSQIDGVLVIPAALDGNTVVSVADSAFSNQSGLTVIGVPTGVASISAAAFDGCDKLIAVNYGGTIAGWKLVENSITEDVRINYLGENIGDLNADGAVNATDLTYIIGYVLEGGELDEVQSYVYDANADGTVNLIDLVRIKKYLAGKSDILGHETAYETEEVVYSVAAVNSFYSANVATVSTDEPSISDYETFIAYSDFLEQIAYLYMLEVDASADPVDLYVKYIRTGVDRYNTGSWGIMAGYENADFAEFVQMIQDASNEGNPEEKWIYINSLKNINNFYLPNGEYVDFGHMFGTMDMTYHNKGSKNHADVGGWAGDIVDLLTAADEGGVTGTIEEMVAEIGANYLNKEVGENGKFSQTDMYGDLDALYIMNELDAENYSYDAINGIGDITKLMIEYFTEDLSMEDRAEYFIDNRMDGISLRSTLRDEVYNIYTGNMVISTLEGTREFTSSNLDDLRKACCYAFADYICKLAGDYVDSVENNYFEVFSTTPSTLAPGVTQEIKYATTADDKQIVYYLATADLTRDDVNLFANYHNNDPASGWEMQTVLEQANAAQNKYGNPESEHYIENYNVIVSTNGAGFNMQTGEPGGLLVMGGVEYHPINANGFVGVLKNGKPVIGTTQEYNTIYKDQVAEGIAVFGATLVKDGKIAVAPTSTYYNDRASRTAIGITKTGKVVMMVLDGRQEPISCGGSMIEIAQIMLDAGCVHAVNLDGGGSTTYVAKAEGADELAVINRPSDGYARSVSTSLMIVSTAPSSTAFDHAVIDSDYDYLTVGSSINLTASGVSATGNAAELPEGTYWVISDESIATVDANGVLTAKTNGTVNVYLMLGEEALAVKPIGVVVPDNIYFTKNSVNAVYGSKLTLPIKVTYMAKSVAYNANDVVLSLNNTKAGVFDGLVFIGNENGGVKNVTITAALKVDSEASDTMLVALFSQGEAVFDFEQATGGDKEMAWDRVITNTTTDDGTIYNVVDADADMVTSYAFAIDMSKIGIPDQLSDLTYMLPGAGSGDATAWNFLCQLAERVSTLTEVKATIKFDSNFIVDYSKLTIVNDYFIHTSTEFDEATNTLVVTLKWIDQTEPIDPTMANPICIVSGVKLTPKADAAWGADGKLAVVNSGDITYDIYLRASALYSFACKEENQQQYGLFPFINPDLPSEKGGHFSSVYKEFEDTYTLIKALKNGWANEDGGFVYYVEGEKLIGVNLIDGYYYDFGTNGVNKGKVTYTGLFYDNSVSAYRYAKFGELQSGWHMIDNEWYYFRNTNVAATGRTKMYGVYYTFEETGRLTTGVWANTLQGTRYYYGPTYYNAYWQNIDGNWYYFRSGCVVKGCSEVTSRENIKFREWHDFGDDGIDRGLVPDDIYIIDGEYYYIANGRKQVGLQKVGDDYYFFLYSGVAITNQTYYAFETHCDLPKGNYEFGADGKMLQGIVEKEDGYYYYVYGKAGREYGLQKIGDDYYLVLMNGKLVTGKVANAWVSYCDLPKGNYYFDDEGKLANGIVTIDGEYYYYVNGKVSDEYGLIKIGDDYYLSLMNGKLVAGKVANAWVSNCDLPKGNYEFGADGKMLQGIVEKADGYYYYVNGKAGRKYGLVNIDGDYYFALMNGKLITNQTYYAWETNCNLPKGNYEFGADGKMLQGIVEKADGYYYYVNGKAGRVYGLVNIDGDYYFALMNGKLITNQTYYAWETNCNLPKGNYEFGADGKMLQGIVEKAGGYYYYVNGKAGSVYGLVNIDGDYYFVLMNGKLVTNKLYGAWETNCDLPKGSYEFGADGKMLQGIVEKADGYYYYMNGKAGGKYGLLEIDGDYYFVLMNGKLVTNQSYYAWETNCDLPKGNYEFGADGKMLNGIVEKNGEYYYYANGRVGSVYGLFELDGYYYFALMNGKLITNQKYGIWESNGLLVETVYTFNELGQIIG